jgi:hypothetical protein
MRLSYAFFILASFLTPAMAADDQGSQQEIAVAFTDNFDKQK